MRFPLVLRGLVIAALGAALLLPLWLIQNKVTERRQRADQVQTTFAAEAGGAQVVAGPFLVLTCGSDTSCPVRVLTPTRLDAKGGLAVEQRYRGIFPARLYRGKVELSGEFDWPVSEAAKGAERAYLVVSISDPRGIKDMPIAEIGKARARFAPGARGLANRSGLHAPLGAADELRKAGPLPFHLELELTGTTRFELAPVGDSNQITIASKWPHPSLVGAYMADERKVSADGFSASWRINEFATGGATYWREFSFGASTAPLVGVSLIEPVNIYSLSFRAIEYGFLFVLFTFGALALVETVSDVTLHPMQYLFVGLALAVFFLLLLALSEHVRFASAYVCAAAACVSLLTYYLRVPLRSFGRTTAFAALFGGLYGGLYVLLKSEDTAMLLGSVLVFVALATAMILTRRLDWGALSRRLAPQPSA